MNSLGKCFECGEEDNFSVHTNFCKFHQQQKLKTIPEVANREIFIKTCEMMFTHYRILGIVDIQTAMNIIRGTLEKK